MQASSIACNTAYYQNDGEPEFILSLVANFRKTSRCMEWRHELSNFDHRAECCCTDVSCAASARAGSTLTYNTR